MKIKIAFCLLIMLINISLTAQNNPDRKRTLHWYFGDRAGVDFSSGTPVADTNGQMSVLQGNATISDTNGSLLFYTDGKTVWNRNKSIMMNGTGLGVGQYGTPLDCSVIIPKPGENNIYYIFTVDGWENQFHNGLRYHVVDMKQDNGNGAVMQKNIQLFTPCSEQLAAINDSSGCGYWLASHELHTANFRTYHITTEGIDTIPIISVTGKDYGITQQSYNLNGGYGLKFTPDGNMAGACVYYGYVNGTDSSDYIDILKFNKGNGQFSSVVSMRIDTSLSSFGFSPNSQYLYYEDGWHIAKDWQHDISSEDAATILNSKTLIYTSVNNIGVAQDWQIGYDGKIYTMIEINDSLSVINEPNIQGNGCGFQKNIMSLANRSPGTALPKFVSNFLVNDTSSICSFYGINEPSEKKSLLVYPNPANEIVFVKADNAIRQIKIMDLIGITIFKDDNFTEKEIINCQPFTNGIYLIQLTTTKNKSLTTKLIINH
jgi:large repetitive protein